MYKHLQPVRFLLGRYCDVKVKEELLADLLPGPVTLVFERSEVLNKDLNPFTPVSQLLQLRYQLKSPAAAPCQVAIDHISQIIRFMVDDD